MNKDRMNKTRRIKKPVNNILKLMGLSNENNNTTEINYGNMNENAANYFKIITPEYTYNVRLDYGEHNNVFNIIQHNKSIMECLIIHIPNNKRETTAYLASVNYYKDCAKNFESNRGTSHMIKTALQYVIDNNKNITHVELKDTTIINRDINPSIVDPFYITTRRLLLGQKGWYEEKCGAVPINDTVRILQFLKMNRHLFEKEIPSHEPKEIWTEKYTSHIIEKICNKTSTQHFRLLETALYFTEWAIPRETIANYKIRYEIDITQDGGGDYKKKCDSILHNRKQYRMPLYVLKKKK
jgi:hypothetical protein